MTDGSPFVERRSIHRAGIWTSSRPLLESLDVELTERCNNACQHCYINLPVNHKQARTLEMSTGKWKAIFRQAADLGALSLRITGGEPLLRDDFDELYLYARKLGMKVRIFTNARLITPDLVQLFSRIPPLEEIEVTAYGVHSASYESNTSSPGSFREFRRGVNLLVESQIPFIIKGVLLPSSKEEIDEFEEWVESIHGSGGRAPRYSLLLTLRGRRDSPTRNLLIKRLRLRPPEILSMLHRREEQYRRDTAQFCQHFIRPPGSRLFRCGAGLGGCIDAYGRYQLCMLLRHPMMTYDLHNGSLKDALQNFVPSVRKMEATNPDYLMRCGRCFLHGLCEQCPAKSWMEHGTLDTPSEYLCQIAHAQASDLGLLEENEKAWEVQDSKARLDKLKKETG